MPAQVGAVPPSSSVQPSLTVTEVSGPTGDEVRLHFAYAADASPAEAVDAVAPASAATEGGQRGWAELTDLWGEAVLTWPLRPTAATGGQLKVDHGLTTARNLHLRSTASSAADHPLPPTSAHSGHRV